MNLADFSSPAFFDNPYPIYERLRQAGDLVPIGPSLMMTGRYDLIEALLHDRRMGKAYMPSVIARYGPLAVEQPVFRAISRMFLMANPPEHTRLRTLLMHSFNARRIEDLSGDMHRQAASLIEAMPATGPVDLMAAYCTPLPLRIICRLLDVPLADGQVLGESAAALVRAFDLAPLDEAGLADANKGAVTLESYFDRLLRARRRQPGDDLLSALIVATSGEGGLSDEEIVANMLLLFVAGHETTSNMLGNALIHLYRDPAQWQQLRSDPSLTQGAVVEAMRFDSSVQMVARTALSPVRVGDVAVETGTTVFMLLGAANRDPAKFDNPDRFDLRRENHGRLISFSAGIHHCLGARLATATLQIALDKLLSSFPDLTITGLDDLRWHRRHSLRGVASLMANY